MTSRSPTPACVSTSIQLSLWEAITWSVQELNLGWHPKAQKHRTFYSQGFGVQSPGFQLFAWRRSQRGGPGPGLSRSGLWVWLGILGVACHVWAWPCPKLTEEVEEAVVRQVGNPPHHPNSHEDRDVWMLFDSNASFRIPEKDKNFGETQWSLVSHMCLPFFLAVSNTIATGKTSLKSEKNGAAKSCSPSTNWSVFFSSLDPRPRACLILEEAGGAEDGDMQF